MSTKHFLQVLAIGPHKRVEIDAKQFEVLKSSKRILEEFSDFTENYRVVVEAYKEVERAKHETELNEILYAKFSYLHSAEIRVSLSAQTFSLLIDWDDARRAAVKSCGNLNNLQRRYVTGKTHVD